jgi:two-component system, OmpR family, phosphate regulon sensor histidine kinase PhoR
MPRLQLKWMMALAALVAVVIGLSGYLVEGGLEQREIAAREADLLHRAELIAIWLAEHPGESCAPADCQSRVARAAARASARVTWIAGDGRVLADSEIDLQGLAAMENHRERPEVLQALESGSGTHVRFSKTLSRDLLYAAARVQPGDAASGGISVVRLASDLATVELVVADLRHQFMLAGGIGLCVALGFAFLLSGLLLRPLWAIRETVRRIARGELGARVRWRSADAFGEVAQAIDSMGEQLEGRVAELTAEKEQLHAVLRGMVEGVLVVDSSGAIVLANRRLCELFGLRGEVEGRSPIEVIRSAQIQTAVDTARTGEEPIALEVEVAQGNRLVLRVQAVGLKTRAGAGAVAVFHDVTEIRRLEAVRRDFVANASHELKTPLTAIRGFAETLVSSALPDAERERYLRIILNHAERVGALVEDLLELSRVEIHKESESPEDPVLDLEPFVRSTLRSLDSMFAARSLSVDVGSLEVPHVRADARALERVLFNLLDNAAKYTERGGKISLHAREEHGHVIVSVQDTGIGISRAHQERIFERFYRVDRARSRELGGTGLGLAIVRHWVERMGGHVGVESEPGRGSTFWFTLPIATD